MTTASALGHLHFVMSAPGTLTAMADALAARGWRESLYGTSYLYAPFGLPLPPPAGTWHHSRGPARMVMVPSFVLIAQVIAEDDPHTYLPVGALGWSWRHRKRTMALYDLGGVEALLAAYNTRA